MMANEQSEMIKARKSWKKAHPGFTSRIHGVVEDSFDAGWQAAMDGVEETICTVCGFRVTHKGAE